MKKTVKNALLFLLTGIMVVCLGIMAACGKKATVTLSKTEVSLVEEESETIEAIVENYEGEVEWSTSDSTIATVANGTIVAVKEGSAVITATAGEASATCAVTVLPKPGPNITFKGENEVSYDFYTNVAVDFNDYVEKEDGAVYAFKIKEKGASEYKMLTNGTFKTYRKGDYTLMVAAELNGKQDALTKEITVADKTDSGATFNTDGTVSLAAIEYSEACGFFSLAQKLNAPYISWEGEYGVGQFVEFTFKGNNMPTVMFFADAIHGNLTNYDYFGSHKEDVLDETTGEPVLNADGSKKQTTVYDFEVLNQKGLIVTPGFGTQSSSAAAWKNGNIQRFTVYGPNRLESWGTADGGYQSAVGNAGGHNVAAAVSYAYLNRVDGTAGNPLGGSYDMFVQGGAHPTTSPTGDVAGLASAKYADTNFRYVVGTVEDSGKVYVVAQMYNADNGAMLGELKIDTKLTADVITAGSIVAYGVPKQDGTGYTFGYSEEPFEMTIQNTYQGLTSNADGTVTLATAGVYNEACGYASVAKKINNSYLGFDGEYGVGTYVDFYFKGNNMPTVMFFADSFNGNLTNYDATDGKTVLNQKGVICTPGFGTANASAGGWKNGNIQRFTVYGPNRLEYNNDNPYATTAGGQANHTTSLGVSYSYLTRVDGTTENPLGGTFDMFVQGGTHPTTSPTGDVSGLSSAKYADTNFHYVIGTEENDAGNLVVKAKMYTVATDGTETLIGELSMATNLPTTELTAGKIVVYASMKQDCSDTTFKYVAPYTPAK